MLRRKLPQTQEAFDQEAARFLKSQGFPNTGEFQKLFAAFIQNSSPADDTYSPRSLAKAIRKQRANEFAFYLMFPEKRPKPELKDVSPDELESSKEANG